MRQDLLHQYLFERTHAARADDKRVVMRSRYREALHDAGRVFDEAYKVRQCLLVVIHHVDEDEHAYRQANFVGVQERDSCFDGANLLELVNASPQR